MKINSRVLDEALKYLEDAIVYFKGQPVGTVASRDTGTAILNYDQVFTRDFFVSAIAFLLNNRYDIVKNFLIQSVNLQGMEKRVDCFDAGSALMPASFKKEKRPGGEYLTADFGDKTIGRVTPIDSSLWWLILLRLYTRMSGDTNLASSNEFQQAVKLILAQYLPGHFELIPTLLVPDGSFMIDRRLGLYGHPLDVEILFYTGLLSAREILTLKEENKGDIEAITHRLGHLAFHISEYYWLDLDRLNRIYRFGTEEYGETVENRYNIYAASIPEWILEWLPRSAGYFIGNLGPGRMDFRFFSSGNLLAVLSSLASEEQSEAIMNLIEARWQDLIGEMPMKLCFPALEGEEWRLLTGYDAKNVPWSYQNAGSWPFLLWLLTAVAIKTNRTHLAEAAFEIALRRLPEDSWPEYYDGKTGRLIGKEARKLQSWTIAGFLAAYGLLDNKAKASQLLFADQPEKNTCDLEE